MKSDKNVEWVRNLIQKKFIQIVRSVLLEHGFDGLYDPEGICLHGCTLDHLVSCGGWQIKCLPGYAETVTVTRIVAAREDPDEGIFPRNKTNA